MADVGGIAADQLRSFIDRLERLQAEKDTLTADIKDVFAEARGAGFDPKIMRQVMKMRRMEEADRQEQETLLALYCRALGMLADTPLGEAALRDVKLAPKTDRLMRKFVDSLGTGDSVSFGDGDTLTKTADGRMERVAAE